LRFSLPFAIGTASIRRGKKHDPVRNSVYRTLRRFPILIRSVASKSSLNEFFVLLATSNARVAPVRIKAKADFAGGGIECGVSSLFDLLHI
jgi:hypothetical protein